MGLRKTHFIQSEKHDWISVQSEYLLSGTLTLKNETQAPLAIGKPFIMHTPAIRERINKTCHES